METTEKIKELEKIQNEIDIKTRNVDKISFVDGIINIEKYLKSPVKILWILKEPYSFEEGVDWREYIKSMNDGSGNLGGFAKTFTNIIYISYGLMNRKKWEDINWIKDDPKIVEVIENIAFINIKKTPGGSRSNYFDLEQYYQKYKDIVIEQITQFEADVVIGGNTISILNDDLNKIYPDLKYEKYVESSDLGVLRSEDVIIFNARHPQNRSTTGKIYCEDIIENYLSLTNK